MEDISISTIDKNDTNDDIVAMSDALLLDVRTSALPPEKTMSMPIAKLVTLGAGVSSLIPAFNTVTSTFNIDTTGLYKLANQSAGDTLKVAKNGDFWGGFFKTAEGKSKYVRLNKADPITATNKMVMNANPATMLMAVALFSIEKEIGNIEEMQKQIIAFLQMEKEANIEGDVKTLTDIITKYKHSWDNELFIASNHKMTCDIQRTARQNMIFYQKQVSEALKSKKRIVLDKKVNSKVTDMLNKFKYYRLTLYTFSLASMIEIMLSGNFKEENIQRAIGEIRENSEEYNSLFGECSEYLGKLSKSSVGTNLKKGIGVASSTMGVLIGSIPKIKDGPVDEFLFGKGEKIIADAQEVSQEVIKSFDEVKNPNTSGFINRLSEMDKIYNHTSEICFDKENLYLVVD